MSSSSGGLSEQQHVAEAALAVVRPHTEPHTRAQASRFLEEWTQTDSAWDIYGNWLCNSDSCFQGTNDHERIGMQLLCLQLLQTKIRRQVPRGSTGPVLERIHHALARLMISSLQQQKFSNLLALAPASICYAALSVRCQGLGQAVAQATHSILHNTAATANNSPPTSANNGNNGDNSMPTVIALRILSQIPLEVEACADLTTPQVAEELRPYVEHVMAACCRVLERSSCEETAALATETLEGWITQCRVSLSELNTPLKENSHSDNSHPTVVLPVLVHILSLSHNASEQLPLKASRALTEAILVPADACTEPRQVAVQALLQAIAQGHFLTAPLEYATHQGWDDACHALANVVCTLVTEEVDYCVTQPCETLLNLLLRIQVHPSRVACAALECWLTVQEVPTQERHDHWKAPLFQRILERIVHRMAYPPHFTDWQEELDIDESEFNEFRYLVKDVLVSCYFLLRSSFIQNMAQVLIPASATTSTQQQSQQQPWFLQEAALFCLTVTAREVCARIKAHGGGVSVGRDREDTTQLILNLAQHFSARDPGTWVHERLVLVGICDWLGAHGTVWGDFCSDHAIYQLHQFTSRALRWTPVPAARALKGILVGSATKLVMEQNCLQVIPKCVQESMEASLATDDEEAMMHVAEGCTRLLVQLPNDAAVQASLGLLISPLVYRCEEALRHVPSSEDRAHHPHHHYDLDHALSALNKYMQVLHVIIKFCERRTEPTGGNDHATSSELIKIVWPFLEAASQRLVSYEPLLKKVLAIHEQLLKNMPLLVAPRFDATVKYVVNIFQVSKDPTALAYLASAVEAYGGNAGYDFESLLTHVFEVLSSYLSSKPLVESCHLIASFYQLCWRYLLYCPAAMARSKALPHICSLGVTCLTECKGESESTREVFNFLSKFYGWRSLPLPDIDRAAMESQGHVLDEITSQNGARLIQRCMDILVGGSQILWVASSDCIFAIVVASSSGHARQWLESVQVKPEHSDVYGQVVLLLLTLALDGPKNRAKAKLLLSDYVGICKGDTSVDALLAYSLA